MRNPFFPVVDQACRTRWCSQYGQPMGLQAAPVCTGCQGRLARVRRFEAGRTLVAAAALALLGGLAVLVSRPSAPEHDPLPPGPPSEPQTVAIDAAAHEELSDLFRGAWRDGVMTAEERGAIDRVTAARRLRANEVAALGEELRPRIVAATRRLGIAQGQVNAGRFEAAVREYRQATEIDPDDVLAWAGLAAACALSGDVREAERANRRALTLDPDNWLANYNLGLAAGRRGESEAALEHFRRALGSLRPGAPERRALVAELRSAPELAALRGDSRFGALLERPTR